ncbi:MAG: hypothetical protein A3H88_00470 [Candidatus Blackburnbacteria bacterium RIFCSPLOWO2_02_FULL_44_9]|nr:MAG: hypothetical protein A3H88_00470 [Candidatus Blackburnbacteria bacterium RIFCSPLOWO2_02_FULL_44_9]
MIFKRIITHMPWFRRSITIAFWPFTDSLLTVLSNAILLKFGAETAVAATIILMTFLNLFLFGLLNKEKEFQEKITQKMSKFLEWSKKAKSIKYGGVIASLFVFTISGPAMAGVPFLWILGIKKHKAYALIIIGSTINSLLWVGGIYNNFWIFIKSFLN